MREIVKRKKKNHLAKEDALLKLKEKERAKSSWMRRDGLKRFNRIKSSYETRKIYFNQGTFEQFWKSQFVIFL